MLMCHPQRVTKREKGKVGWVGGGGVLWWIAMRGERESFGFRELTVEELS